MNTRKLQSALIETGKEAEAMKEVPRLSEMDTELANFKSAVYLDDLIGQRRHGRKLTAMLTKFMIEKL